jgi:hypothetical protein
MNTLKKLSTAAVLGVLALTSTVPARAGEMSEMSLPGLSAAKSEIGRAVATDLTAQLRAALNAPRIHRMRQSPSVTITEEDAMVMVVAKRLPSIDTMDAMRVAGSAQVRL